MKLHIDPEAPRSILDEGDNLVAKVFVTLGVDVQDNRLECQLHGWGAGEECWSLKNLLALVEGEAPSLLEDDHHYEMVADAIEKAEGK